ncbi:MAG: polynucleotide adenylyltransferase PcnB [Proteobacteria bacterium]|nr:polynucleotide adenylyltransferase PcnB [Pseudomonadota bacterium]
MSKIKLQTYNQSQHGVNTDEISPSARAIITQLIDHGFQAYIVGGAVRDLLLGKHPKDFDIATDATPDQIKDVFLKYCRLIGRRFRLAHVYQNREMFEVATFRGVAQEGDRVVKQGRIIKDNVYGTIEQDAIRRDFTCNALYLDIENGNILDYCDGLDDIKDHKLKFIGDDSERIIEDPIRMIRAIRFEAKLGLKISDKTKQAILQEYKTLSHVSMARLFDELVKLFHCGSAFKAFQLMNELLLFPLIFPQASKEMNKNEQHLNLVCNALRSTDSRIESGKSVTPIFLFSCFLWPMSAAFTDKYIKAGLSEYDAINKASNDVFHITRKTVSIPRIVQIGIRNIWLLQYRFKIIRGKKVFFTLEHQRFRAAYDFLLLRKQESEELDALGVWWTNIQTLSKTKQKELAFPKNNPEKKRKKLNR